MTYSIDRGSWPKSLRWRILIGCTPGIRGVTRSDEIFLIQGILMRFNMIDCKSMTTPMMKNMKKLSDSALDSNLVDPTMYRDFIRSLMYLVNVMPNIFFTVSTLSQYLVEAKEVPVGGSEVWYSWIWFNSTKEVRLQRYTNFD